MQTKSHNDYFDFGKIENEKFWRRLGGKPGFKDKSKNIHIPDLA